MAEHHPSDENSGGTMDIRDHVRTWLSFWNGVKYSVVGLIVIAVLLAIFRTHNGY
jgi:hypothetical protein